MDHVSGALAWYDAGCSILAIYADGTKKPQGKWGQYMKDRADRATVEQWFKTSPKSGVGIVCGAVSENLEMTEIESVRMGSEYWDRIDEAMKASGVHTEWTRLVEDGYTESTPSGGIHVLYRVQDQPVPGNTKIALDVTGKITYAETRGEGGFVVVAPSSGAVHKTGDSWSVMSGQIGKIPTISWDVRCLIHEALREALDERVLPTYERPAGQETYDRSQGDRPGDAFEADSTVTIHDILTRNGWKFLGKTAGQDRYVHPLSSDMSTHSACTGWKGSPNLYAWSGLPREDYYTKFGLLAELEFGGDYSKTSSYLRGLGYGSTRETLDISDWFESQAADAVTGLGDDMESTAPAVETAVEGKTPTLTEHTETGVAHLAVKVLGGKFRAVYEEKGWRAYHAGVWAEAKRSEVPQAIEKVTEVIRRSALRELEQAKETEDKDTIKQAERFATFANSCRQERGSNAIRSLFGKQKGVGVAVEDFDADHNLVCLANGTMDLRTMTLRDHSPADMLTKKIDISFDPSAVANEFEKYLVEVLPDPEYRSFIKRAAGMTLVGDMKEAAFFVLHGPTGCGKSVFLSIMAAVFGDFAATAAPGTFKVTRGKSTDDGFELQRLRGARFASLSETSEATMLNEELIKRVTGGDSVTSRAPYQDFITWKPQFTMWMATNFKPNLNSDDSAIWRRVKPIEFPTSFYSEGRTPDTGLTKRIIADELPGVLNWLLEGAAEYLEKGLAEPSTLKDSINEYRAEVDPVTQFMAESISDGVVVEDPEGSVLMTELYRVYHSWAIDNGMRALGKNRFGNRLQTMGYPPHRGTGGVRVRKGLRVNQTGWLAQNQRPQWG